MALPKIDSPVYDLELPVSKKKIQFRPFLVKEQRNLMMALESDDAETISKNIRQVLINCTLTEKINIDELPIVDVEYYFLNLRSKSVSEIVEARYKCNNEVDGKVCGNMMETEINLLDIKVDVPEKGKDIIQLTDSIAIRMKYPQFSAIKRATESEDINDLALALIIDAIDMVYDGQQAYPASESSIEELKEFVESLNQAQFKKIEDFFDELPKLEKTLELKCSKCGFNHQIYFEGLESFFD